MKLEISYQAGFSEFWQAMQEKYPRELFQIEGVGDQLDREKFRSKFYASEVTADASIDANANVDDISVIAYNTESHKPVQKLDSYHALWCELRDMYQSGEVPSYILDKQLSGELYIHDFHGIASGSPYCFNYSTYDIMLQGLPMVNKIKSIPPKYLSAFKSQLEQFTVIASNSTLGATGLADLLIVMSYYVKNLLETKKDDHFTLASEEDCWAYVDSVLTSFIYTVNQPMRANQSPFTNISIYDRYFLEELRENYLFPDGTYPDIEIVEEMQALFLVIMNREKRRTPVTFPVTTACFSVDAERNNRDQSFVRFIAEMNEEFGFINLYHGDSSTLSSCCRLRSSTENSFFNSFGAGSTKLGSLGVGTSNLVRLAMLSSTRSDAPDRFISRVREAVEIIAAINEAKRRIVRRRIAGGNLPLYTLGFMDINKQYSTFGVNGKNEALEILGYDILTKEGQEFAVRVITEINEVNDRMEQRYQSPHNAEQVPGENMSIKLANKDKLLGYKNKYSIYSNQFIPLTVNADMLDRMRIQGLLDKHFSGGAILHLNLEQRVSEDRLVELTNVAAKLGIVYWAPNYNEQECTRGHMTVGRGEVCTICGEEIVANYTRVVGFLTNTKNWHKARRDLDYPHRQFYVDAGSGVAR